MDVSSRMGCRVLRAGYKGGYCGGSVSAGVVDGPDLALHGDLRPGSYRHSQNDSSRSTDSVGGFFVFACATSVRGLESIVSTKPDCA